ncbi:hypothetical protein [Glycomyces tenuis]|uniref:hypothetical protein n=1 Tax=Glycomyces tenuis TaxID=58116 RepID=UPI000408A13C|nr:hypothetical protein [Glycomyces tenuis]
MKHAYKSVVRRGLIVLAAAGATAASALALSSEAPAHGALIDVEIHLCLDLPLLPPLLPCPASEPPSPTEPPDSPHPPSPSHSPSPSPSPTTPPSPPAPEPTTAAPESPSPSEPAPAPPPPEPTPEAPSPSSAPPSPVPPLPEHLAIEDPEPVAETDSDDTVETKRRMMAVMLAFTVASGAGAAVGRRS